MEYNTYIDQYQRFSRASLIQRPEFVDYYEHPCLGDDSKSTGFDAHYIYHVAWAIKKLYQSMPESHVDVSSSLNFCTAVCSFTPIKFIDLRPANIHLENLNCVSGDLTNESEWYGRNYRSLSCMHVVEHIGLGRYGDEIDVNGDIRAMNNLKISLSQGGRLLFVVPVGRSEIYFNAHRVYSAFWIRDFFSDMCELLEFTFIPGLEDMKPVVDCDFHYADRFRYGCGCFEFSRR